MKRRPTSRRGLVLAAGLLVAGLAGLGALLARGWAPTEPGAAPDRSHPADGDAPHLLEAPPVHVDEALTEVAAPLRATEPASDGRNPRELHGVVLRHDGTRAAKIEVGLFGDAPPQQLSDVVGYEGERYDPPASARRGPLLRKARTDKDGNFVFEAAPLGRSVVCAPPWTWIEASQVVEVDGVRPPDPVTLQLPPSGNLVGLLMDKDTVAGSGWTVLARNVDHPEMQPSTVSSSAGHFAIPDLAAGFWDLYAVRGLSEWKPETLVRPANGQPGVASWFKGSDASAQLCLYLGRVEVPILVEEPRFDVSAFVPNSVLVHVRSGGSSCPDAMVSVFLVQAGGRGCLCQYLTHKDGTMQFTNLWPGDYDFEVRPPGSTQTADVKRLTLGSGESLALELQADR